MSQPSSPSASLKRANRNESRADKHKQRKAVTFKSSATTVPGDYETPIPSISDTPVPGTSGTPVSGTFDTPVPGTSNTPVLNASDTAVSGTSDTCASGTSDTPVHEEPSRSSSSPPTTPTIPVKFFPLALQRQGAEFFPHPPESDASCNMPNPATSQSTPRRGGNYARRAKLFIPKYSSPGPSRLELKNATTLRDQSFYDLSDSKSDESSSVEDDDSDKENEDPEAPRPNKDFKESGTGSEEPLGSSSFMLEYQRNRQELFNKLTQANGYNMPFDNRLPFPGPHMQSQQDSNGPLHDHVQEGSEDNEPNKENMGSNEGYPQSRVESQPSTYIDPKPLCQVQHQSEVPTQIDMPKVYPRQNEDNYQQHQSEAQPFPPQDSYQPHPSQGDYQQGQEGVCPSSNGMQEQDSVRHEASAFGWTIRDAIHENMNELGSLVRCQRKLRQRRIKYGGGWSPYNNELEHGSDMIHRINKDLRRYLKLVQQ